MDGSRWSSDDISWDADSNLGCNSSGICTLEFIDVGTGRVMQHIDTEQLIVRHSAYDNNYLACHPTWRQKSFDFYPSCGNRATIMDPCSAVLHQQNLWLTHKRPSKFGVCVCCDRGVHLNLDFLKHVPFTVNTDKLRVHWVTYRTQSAGTEDLLVRLRPVGIRLTAIL